MSSALSNQARPLTQSDELIAAILASSLVTGGHTSPMATNVDMAAKQAVEIYAAVLENLREQRSP